MTRPEAIATLLTAPTWAGRFNQAELQCRIDCLKALGVTRDDIIAAKKLMLRSEIDALRAEADAKEVTLPAIDTEEP